MKITLSTTVRNVSPVIIPLNFPQAGKPIQNTHFKLSRVHTIVALNKWITKIVNREMLQLAKCTIIEVQIVWISCLKRNKLTRVTQKLHLETPASYLKQNSKHYGS